MSHTFTNADRSVLSHGKVIVDFYKSTCGPCNQIAPRFERLAKSYPSITCVKVNCDDHPKVAEKFKVHAVPTFLSLVDGKEVDKIVGAAEEDLAQLFSELSER